MVVVVIAQKSDPCFNDLFYNVLPFLLVTHSATKCQLATLLNREMSYQDILSRRNIVIEDLIKKLQELETQKVVVPNKSDFPCTVELPFLQAVFFLDEAVLSTGGRGLSVSLCLAVWGVAPKSRCESCRMRSASWARR